MKLQAAISRVSLFAASLSLVTCAFPTVDARPFQDNPSATRAPQQPPPNQPNNPGRPSQPPPSKPNPGGPPGRPPQGPPPRPPQAPGRPPGRPPGPPRPGYAFRPGDRDRMRRYYARNLGYINRGRRPVFVIGRPIPLGYRPYFRPVPPPLLRYLPPPPPGYAVGYFDGYCVVYDPVTFAIVGMIDLLD